MPPIMHPQHVRLLNAAMIPADQWLAEGFIMRSRARQASAEQDAARYAEWCQFHDEDTRPELTVAMLRRATRDLVAFSKAYVMAITTDGRMVWLTRSQVL